MMKVMTTNAPQYITRVQKPHFCHSQLSK